MKLENTLENKAKFFAQYWGQNILTLGTNKNYPIITSWMSCLMEDTEANGDYVQCLELTLLSQITDEGAIHCLKIGCYNDVSRFYFHQNEDGLLWTLYFNQPKCGKNSEVTNVSSYVIDYLRSKGYAIPFMGLSVDDLIEYGWVKLKEVKI